MILLGKCFVVEEDMLHTKGALGFHWTLLSCWQLPPWQLDSVSLSRFDEVYVGIVQACGLVKMEMSIELSLHM